ncbi:MAG TPA: ABC transporter permease [Candidatus Acidoferrales bacterium]|nr:ABC transporter permease [Candidatus Acidoferrales bacterium]
MLNSLLRDLRFGWRMLAKSPAFAAVAVATLALGIGANTAIFSVVYATMLRPLPYRQPDRLVMVWENNRLHSRPHNVVSPANFLVWRGENSVFDQMAGFQEQPANLTGAGEPERIAVEYATSNLFSLLGANPAMGRAFTAEEGIQGRDQVAILSYGLWQRRFGGDPRAIGKTIRLNGNPLTIVGVMPRGFQFFIKSSSLTGEAPDVWAPLAFAADDRLPHGRWMKAVARLKPGVTFGAAQEQMNRMAASLAQKFPDFDTGWGVNLAPIREELTGAVRPALLVLFAAVGLVLLIACANVASLMLARGASRGREMAVRTALGAGRGRLLRQLLTESMVVSLAGGALGVELAYAGTRGLVALAPKGLLDLTSIHLNGLVLGFTAGLSILTGILFGLAPALGGSRVHPQDALKEGGRGTSPGRTSQRVRSVLVVVEVALALVLVAGAGLLIRSLELLEEVNPGFQPGNLLTAKLLLPQSKYGNDAGRVAFFGQLLGRVRAMPGVRSASGDAFVPFTTIAAGTDFTIVGRPAPPPGNKWITDVHVVFSDYFQTMGMPLVRGREFDAAEQTAERHVVIINEALARRYFANENPLGRQLVIDMKDENPPSTIVGVVDNVRQLGLDEAPHPTVYWPYPELPYLAMTLVVRTGGDPTGAAPALRAQVASLDPDLPVAGVQTMDDWLGDSLARARFAAALLGLFALIALALAAVGVYSVMAYAVSERTHEIGIRMALGAERADVLRLVLARGAGLALAGVAAGLAGGLAVTRSLESLLYGVQPTDSATFASGAALLVAVALAACYLPARRATRTDPVAALRNE